MQFRGTISDALPTADTDGTLDTNRLSKYGESVVQPVMPPPYPVANEGTYYKCINPTMGSGIAGHTQATFSNVAPLMFLRNVDTDPLLGRTVYLDYIRLTCTALAVAATNNQFSIVLDWNDRFSAGGTILTAFTTNTDAQQASVTGQTLPQCSIRFGSITLSAPTSFSARNIARFSMGSTAPALGDTIFINFASQDTNVGAGSIPLGPVALGPRGDGNANTFILYNWLPGSTSAPSYEIEMGWWER